jgi:DNA-binding MarR family transcriptional regulator
MNPVDSTVRERRLDDIAEALPQRATAISRLFVAHTSVEISRTEIGVLRALSDRPRRITELAALEGVSQPGITTLVTRLEARGWVARETDPSDARAGLSGDMLVGALVDAGQYRALLHEEMATLPDRDVAALARAVEILDGLIDRLKERG